MGVFRLLLALAVVISHSSPLAGFVPISGPAAVQCFYVMSGFYMQLVLSRSYRHSLRSTCFFYLSRYLRLAPTYWIVLALTVVATLAFSRTIYYRGTELGHLVASMSPGTKILLVLSNLLILGQDTLHFLTLDVPSGQLAWTADFTSTAHPAYKFLLVPQAWTLGVELIFYFLAPFLLRTSTLVIAAIAAASVGLRIVLASNGLSQDPWSYRFFPNELALFLLGSLAYRAYAAGWFSANKSNGYLMLGALLLLTLAYDYIPASEAVKRTGTLILVAVSLPTLFWLTKNSERDLFVGKLSYPVYVSHLLLVGFARYAGKHRGFALIALSIAFALIVVRYVENPIDEWRRRFRST